MKRLTLLLGLAGLAAVAASTRRRSSKNARGSTAVQKFASSTASSTSRRPSTSPTTTASARPSASRRPRTTRALVGAAAFSALDRAPRRHARQRAADLARPPRRPARCRAQDTRWADKVVAIDTARRTVRYAETDGFARGNPVRYVSTDSTDELAAALEAATFAPALNAASFAGGDGTDSARASLAAFVNGQTGAANPQRQGLNSAVSDGLDPLNVLAWTPNQGRYSPLWDVHLAAWSPAAVAAGGNVRQRRFADVDDLARAGAVTAPGGGRFGPSEIIVNCPIISER